MWRHMAHPRWQSLVCVPLRVNGSGRGRLEAVTVSCRPFRCLLRSRQQGWLELTRQNFGKKNYFILFIFWVECVRLYNDWSLTWIWFENYGALPLKWERGGVHVNTWKSSVFLIVSFLRQICESARWSSTAHVSRHICMDSPRGWVFLVGPRSTCILPCTCTSPHNIFIGKSLLRRLNLRVYTLFSILFQNQNFI